MKRILKVLFYSCLALCAASISVHAVPNPAAAYAAKLGYEYSADGGSETVTVADGVVLDAWDFYRGKVGNDYAYGAQFGYDTVNRRVETNGCVRDFAVCVPRKTLRTGTSEEISLLELMKQNGEPLWDDAQEAPPAAIEAMMKTAPLKTFPKQVLPESFDWRNYGGSNYIGAVRNQGSCGSCYSFGAAAAAEGTFNYAMGKTGSSCVDFSEAYIAWCLGTYGGYSAHFSGCDGADYDYAELEALTIEGICGENQMPYNGGSDPGSCTYSGTTTVFDAWSRVAYGDIDAIKAAIMTYGVVDAAVYVDTAFDGYNSGVHDDSNNTCDSGWYTTSNHAISLVGWDDTPPEGGGGCWILRNSWGTSWGESGYMRIRYDAAVVHCAVCYMQYGPPPETPPTLNAVGNKTVTWSNTLQFAVTATVTDGDAVTLTVSNKPAAATFGTTNANGTFTWANAGPMGVYTMTFYAADNDGVDSEVVRVTVGDGSAALGLFISEYIEGSSNNKAIEIYNGTGGSVSLGTGNYDLRLYANGSTSPTTIDLTGTIADGDVFVVANSSANATILAQADLSTGSLGFNGNDVVALAQDGSNIDVVGTIGSSLDFAVDVTKVRKSTVAQGTTTYDTGEWDDYAIDTTSYLGSHTFGGGGGPVAPTIVITNPASASLTVSNAVSTYSLQGTCNTAAVGQAKWTNALTGASGTISASTGWTISSVALNVGANPITVSVTNASGSSANDSVTITRSALTDTNFPVISFNPTGTNHTATVGVQLIVTVNGTDADGDEIVLTDVSLPGGSFPGDIGASPVSSDFTWTPGAAGNYTASFEAEDNDGAVTSTIRIVVSDAVPAAPASIWASATNSTDFTAAWSSVSGASSYRLDVGTNNTFSGGGAAGAGTNCYHNGTLGAGTGGTWTETGLTQGSGYLVSLSGDVLITPVLDLTTSSSETLNFKARTYGGVVPVNNTITVSVSTNNGSSWTVMGTRLPLNTTLTAMSPFDLSGFNASQVLVKFENLGASSSVGAGIDDVLITNETGGAASAYVDGYEDRALSGTSQSVTGLTAGATYYFRARAVSAGGTSSNSFVASVTTLTGEPPADPFEEWVTGQGQDPDDPDFASGADYDLDGLTTLQEYYADTDPADGNSVFRGMGSAVSLNQALTFPASTNRRYSLYYKSDIADASWLPILSDIQGTNAIMTLTDTNVRDRVYYRLEAELLP